MYWLKIGLFLVISENFLKIMRENNVLAICISYKNHYSSNIDEIIRSVLNFLSIFLR